MGRPSSSLTSARPRMTSRGDDLEVNVGLVEAVHILGPAPVLDACRVDALDAVGLVGPHHPGDIGGGLLHVALLEVAHDEPVVAEDHVCAHIQDRGRAHLLVGVARLQGRHGSFKDGGVAHGSVIVALLVDGRDSVAAARVGDVRLLAHRPVVIFGAHEPAGVHLGSGHVGVGVHASGHDRLACGIDDCGVSRLGPGETCHDLSVFYENILDFPVYRIEGIEDVTVLDNSRSHSRTPPAARAISHPQGRSCCR